MANLKDAFIVRPLPESDEFIITIGNHLATEETKLVCVIESWKLYPKENEKTNKN